jgi:iron complex transport system substrate-binding protein
MRTPRALTTAAVVAVAALTLAACSSSTDDAPDSSATASPAASASADASAAAFPVTVTDMYGDVTIESEPQRVLTIGSREHELLYSLGVAPVAVPESWQGYPNGTGPWADEARIAAGAEPETFATGELNYEVIASFQPDLIVGTYAGLTEDQYAALSAIAPTLAQTADYPAYGMPLDEELHLIAKAVGKTDEADAVMADINAQFADVRAAHPEFEGKTGVVAFYYDGNPGVYHSTDNRNQFLANLGLKVDGLDEYVNDQFYITVSAEQLDLLSDYDTVLWQTATTPEVEATIESLPLYPGLGVTEKGGNIWITEPVLEGAFFANSPSSIQYSLDAFVPQLAAALDGDPATEVPAFSDAA